ncbi:MAG: hypothetical protein QNI87_02960 [Erythrobacter sp.]|uniref:hypothetical protein n=1 Tax=Erythrobacter sp. TaxID=1042 RepID=UPI00262CABD8|nr:hypothetical protein [Erythrobacter sp.]MDJ0977470.1 hypothetical protein [Erythrobacter sp.]
MNGSLFALLALVPLMAGATAHDEDGDAITVALCNGGEITIDLTRDNDAPARDCDTKGCHAGACREKSKTKAFRPA